MTNGKLPVAEVRSKSPKIEGSIGRKWAVDGVTTFKKPLVRIGIEVWATSDTKEDVVKLASLHENGHAACVQDIVANIGDGETQWNVLTGYNRWQCEVEAWMRGLEGHTINFTDATLILDCMNSYRRGIPATKAEWDEFVTLLGTVYDGPVDDLRVYVPLEPDPGEKPRECLPGVFTDDDGRGGERDYDDGNGEGAHSDYESSKHFDNGWLAQDVLDEVASGKSIEDIAKARGLDVNALPPVVAAFRK